jgi:hypothetical protein
MIYRLYMGFGCFGGFYRCGIRVDSPTQKERSIFEALCRDVMAYVWWEKCMLLFKEIVALFC